jgi:hypothetical protein
MRTSAIVSVKQARPLSFDLKSLPLAKLPDTCHGDPAHPKSLLANSLNPPAPQFMNDMPDMPKHHNYYILQHGIRWTAMRG